MVQEFVFFLYEPMENYNKKDLILILARFFCVDGFESDEN
jgi:hypothetical protein